MSPMLKGDILCLQALLNNSYLYHLAHGKDFESRGIESKTFCLFLKISAGHFILWCFQVPASVQLRWRESFLCYICRTMSMLNLTIRHLNPLVTTLGCLVEHVQPELAALNKGLTDNHCFPTFFEQRCKFYIRKIRTHCHINILSHSK